MREFKTKTEAEEYLNEIPKFSAKTTPENERKILALLGDPQRGQRFVHVAGTNGKGSVCAFMSRILRENGYHVGMFTSPHLVDINERFEIDGKMISDEVFLDAFCRVYKVVEEHKDEVAHPSYFEFLFLMSMLIFSDSKTDISVLEVGLGGRLDATNIIEDPLVSIITSISLEHTQYLGNTVQQIATEKAGIIKPGCPVVYDGSVYAAVSVIKKIARENISAEYRLIPTDFVITKKTDKSVSFRMVAGLLSGEEFELQTPAEYQVMNAALALTAAEILRADGYPESDETEWRANLKRAIALTRWPGRMEEILPGVFVDGAHTSDAILAFVPVVNRLTCSGSRYLMFSVVSDKDYEAMISALCRRTEFDGFVITGMKNPRGVDPRELAPIFRRHTDKEILTADTVEQGLEIALAKKKPGDLLFIAGSLYMVGEVKKILKDEVK